MSPLAFNLIKDVCYVAPRQELWIEFADFIKPSYKCAVFVNVPRETAVRLKNAANRDEFFQLNIRAKFKHYLWFFDNCVIFDPANWNKTADDIATAAEIEERLQRELESNDIAAMDAW